MMCLCYLVFGPVVVACCCYSNWSKSRRRMQLLHLQAQALEDRRWALGSEDFIWHCSDEIFQADVGRKHQTMAGESRVSQKRQGLWLGWSGRFCDPQVHENLWVYVTRFERITWECHGPASNCLSWKAPPVLHCVDSRKAGGTLYLSPFKKTGKVAEREAEPGFSASRCRCNTVEGPEKGQTLGPFHESSILTI